MIKLGFIITLSVLVFVSWLVLVPRYSSMYDNREDAEFIGAIASNDSRAVQKFIDSGGNIDFRGLMRGEPILESFRMQNFEIFKMLLDAGATIHGDVHQDRSIAVQIVVKDKEGRWLNALLDAGLDANLDIDRTPLMCFSVRSNNKRSVEILLQSGASVSWTDPHGNTPLEIAVAWQAWDCALVLIELLNIEDFTRVSDELAYQEQNLLPRDLNNPNRRAFIEILKKQKTKTKVPEAN